MLIDWEKNQAFDENDRPVAIPAEWMRGVRVRESKAVINVVRYDTETHLLARHAKNRRGQTIASAPLIIEEIELEPMPAPTPMVNRMPVSTGQLRPHDFSNVGFGRRTPGS